jgi:hypothetical protein
VCSGIYSRGEETEGDKGDDRDVSEVGSKVSSCNNLSFARTLFDSTPSFARVLKELRSFSKPIAFKSLLKDK